MVDTDTAREFEGRLVALETKEAVTIEQVKAHDIAIKSLDSKLVTLVDEVKNIRNAMYFLAAAISANVPALQHLAQTIKLLLMGH